MDYLDDLLEKRSSLDEQLETINDRAAAETRALTDPERESAEDLRKRIGIIDERLSDSVEQAEARRAHETRMGKFDRLRGQLPEQRGRAPQQETTSFGQAFVDSEEFRSYPGRGVGRPVSSTAMTALLESRAAITTSNLAIPGVVLPTKVRDVVMPPLLQVVDVVSVGGGVAEWVEVTGDPIAAMVAEGAAKPEAGLTFTPKSATLETIAHWVQITRQALADAPYIRSVIEGKLRRGLLLKITDDLAAALAAATLPTASGSADSGMLGAIRVGIATVQDAGHNPNAVLLNPADWADLDMAVMGATVNGPVQGSTFWGLRPVSSADQPAGTATVGDFEAGVTYFDRNATDVFVTDSHADLFIRNVLVVLAEARGKSAVTDTTALCECTVGRLSRCTSRPAGTRT